jgi:hypothetical protein
VLRQNPDADLPACYADDGGENDRSLITSDTKTRPLKPGTDCQIEFRLIHISGSSSLEPTVSLVCPPLQNVVMKTPVPPSQTGRGKIL